MEVRRARPPTASLLCLGAVCALRPWRPGWPLPWLAPSRLWLSARVLGAPFGPPSGPPLYPRAARPRAPPLPPCGVEIEEKTVRGRKGWVLQGRKEWVEVGRLRVGSSFGAPACTNEWNRWERRSPDAFSTPLQWPRPLWPVPALWTTQAVRWPSGPARRGRPSSASGTRAWNHAAQKRSTCVLKGWEGGGVRLELSGGVACERRGLGRGQSLCVYALCLCVTFGCCV